MSTTITCPGCGRPLNVPPEAVGGPAHCPHCRANFTIPRLPDGSAGPPEAPARRFRIPPTVAAPGFALLAVNLFALVVNGGMTALTLGRPDGALFFTRQWVQQLRSSEEFEAAKDAAREKSRREVTAKKGKEPVPEPPPPAAPDPVEEERRREQDEALARAWGPLVLPLAGWSLLMSVFGSLGGLSVLRGRHYWLALLGAGASLLNVNNLCCVPAGIAAVWAALVLIRDDGRAWFGRG